MWHNPNKSVNRQGMIEAFGNIAHIQTSITKSDHDKFLLYRWECEALGGKTLYVFKTSEMSIEMALKMGGKIKIGKEDSTLYAEPVNFNRMHKRVKKFITLTLWVFHPTMHCMQILAVMECLQEDSTNIELFFKIFNEAMTEYLGEPGYIWDPFLLMMDEKGENFDAIGKSLAKILSRRNVKLANSILSTVQRSI